MLVHCHAGCNQERVIAALRGRGLWANDGLHPLSRKVRRTPVEPKPDLDDTRRSEAALAIWGSAKRAQGTLVEVYLASRGIHLAAPDALRFHPGLKHPSGGIWPAMVALVTRGHDGKPLAIHRTYLARDGIGKGAGRAAEDDARSLPWWCRAPRQARGRADGRRRHRDLPRRDAGERPSRLGGAFDLGIARP